MKFLAEDDKLTITFEGREMVLALKRKLVLPRENIVDLIWAPEFNYSDLLLRIGGANVPRVIDAGRFRDLDTRENLFLYLLRPRGLPAARTLSATNVLTVTMQGYRYAKIFVNCQPDIGVSLMNWFKNTRS